MSAAGIIATAIRLADEEGLDRVSIRRIAKKLDGRPMSIYEHFDSKEELLSAMADEAVAEVLVAGALPDGWREALMKIAHRLYAALVRHPWIVPVFTTNPRFGPSSEKQAMQLAAAMSSLGLPSAEIWVLVGTMNDYVLGHSLRAVTVAWPAELEGIIEAEAIEAAPELASLPAYLKTRALLERFEAGLEVVLDGIERRCRERDT